MPIQSCPCGGAEYARCCQPLHLGQAHAVTAEQLMRSRYSAFALAQIDYIVQTTAIAQQATLDRAAITDWSQSNRWLGLEVLQTNEQLDKHHALVEFRAHYDDGQPQQHYERSYFVRLDERWFFLDPTTTGLPTMKQPCVCGSLKKFKHCCAQYL